MPDRNFNHPEIDTELLPCHDSSLSEHADITTQVSEYFREAMDLFIGLKKAGKLGSTSLVAHRAFVWCISYRHDTKTVSYSDFRHSAARPQEFYVSDDMWQKNAIDYTSLVVERDGSISSGPPQYYIKFHHAQSLPIGYFDDETHEYHALGDDDFQKRWAHLLQKMLQTGFVAFLEWHAESLTSRHLDEILGRNLPRLGDQNLRDIEDALAYVLSRR